VREELVPRELVCEEQAWQRPRLRAVEVLATAVEGRQMYCLRDPGEPDGGAVLVSREALLLLSLMDGERDLDALRAAFALRTGAQLLPSQVEELVRGLDEACLLVGPRFERHRAAQRADFHAAPLRAAIHAGGAYPGDEAALDAALEGHFSGPDGPNGPGRLPERQAGHELVGLVAPHVDLHRGGPTYAWAYRALAEAESPELIVLLGTCHAPMDAPFAATTKDYDTPYGPLPTDAAFVRDLAARYSGDLFADEFAHRAEHALELQAVYLRYLQRIGRLGPVQVVPILCGSPHAHGPSDPAAGEPPEIAEFLALLAERLAADGRRVCLLAGADLAHVGPQFGDAAPVNAPFLAAVDRADRALLALAAAGDAAGFYQSVMGDGDRRRICGIAPMYSLLRLLPAARGEVLRYTQWADPSGYASVSFASVAYYRA
jgi:AmmeMemoRadiSam system protein B